MSDGAAAYACPECDAFAGTAASYCERCGRPLPALAAPIDFPRKGILPSARRHRQPRGPDTFAPLPEAVVRDLEGIRREGRPLRAGRFLKGTSPLRWLVSVLPALLVGGAALAIGLIFQFAGRSGGREIMGTGIVGALVLFALLYVLGGVLTPLAYAILNSRAGGDRLLLDCRAFVYAAEEGLLWHNQMGLRFVPWAHVEGFQLEAHPQYPDIVTLTFRDSRSRQEHRVATEVSYKASDFRALAEDIRGRLGGP